MRQPSAGTLASVAALALVAFLLWPTNSPELSIDGSHAQRQLQEFTFKTRTSFPPKLDDTDTWIHYGIYVGVVAAVFILVGIIISITLCIGFCCRRCCCNFSKHGSKPCWSILFVVYFAVLCLLAIFIIAFSASITTGISGAQKSTDTFVNSGVPGAFDNVADQIAPLTGEIVTIINDTLGEIQRTAFESVDDLVNFASGKLVDADNVLVGASTILNKTDDQFTLLKELFTRLQAFVDAGILSSIPSNDSVPNVRSLTTSVLADGRVAVGDMRNQLANLSTAVTSARNEASMSNSAVQGVIKTVNDSVNSVVNSIGDAKKSFVDMKVSENYVHKYDNYIALQYKIRLPVMILLAIIPVVLSGLWFLGALTTHHRFMLVGFWWAAGICWLFLLLAAIHTVIFIPVKDVCYQRNDLIVTGAHQFYFTDGANYSAKIGISSPTELVGVINGAVGRFFGDPDLLLDCDDDESLVTQLGIDLPAAFGISNRVANLTRTIQQQADALNVTGKISDAQPTFSSMDKRVNELTTNITVFNSSLTNYTNDYVDIRSRFTPSEWWNASTEAEAQTRLDQVNDLTQNTIPSDTWDFTNIQNMDPDDYVLLTSTQRNNLTANQQLIIEAVKLNNSVISIEQGLNDYKNITDNLDDLLQDSQELVNSTARLVTESWARVNISVSLPTQIINSINGFLNPSVDRIIEIARLENLGKCKFLGDWVRSTVTTSVCRNVGSAAGGVGISMFLIAIAWLVWWPIILSSKTFWAGGVPSHGVADGDLWSTEMDTKRRYE